MKKIWITWEKHRRTRELASVIPGIRLFELELDAPRFVRYPCLLLRTVTILVRERPGTVIIQNPSIVLAIFVVIIGRIANINIVVDSHNEGIMPFYPSLRWLIPIYALIQKWTDLTIVTNQELATIVRNNGGRPFVLADKIPTFRYPERITLKGENRLVFVCTFAKDEPYEEVIKAAELLDLSTTIYITGDSQKVSSDIPMQAPANVIFTGFLPDRDYINLLYSSDIIIDLTFMDNCLVCGAYEAVALGKPIILSDSEALRAYFFKGAVYTENTADGIAESIRSASENLKRLRKEILDLRAHIQIEWAKQCDRFIRALE
ncbi:MAG: glycosyltransferase [Thermodesulfobacteriota bacterium]|nr:glycosyltransferase [Thermodesulfobacteriota bacterium]